MKVFVRIGSWILAKRSDTQEKQETIESYKPILIEAWINTRMERDKSLLHVASAGLGVLVALLTLKGSITTLQFVVSLVAFIGFLFTIVVVIVIFQQNAVYIQEFIINPSGGNKVLKILDRIVTVSFVTGIIAFLSVGLLSMKSDYSTNPYNENANEDTLQVDSLLNHTRSIANTDSLHQDSTIVE